MGLELYIYDDELWYMTGEGRNERLEESNTEVVSHFLRLIMECYPEAYKALSEIYKNSATNVPYYQYLIVRRFCKCNFGSLDITQKDLTDSDQMNFEKVPCPLRGECKHEGIICCPKFCSVLSKSEIRVMKMVVENIPTEAIAEKLYLSPNTIKNHIKSVYRKLGIHEKSEFVQYALKNNLFE